MQPGTNPDDLHAILSRFSTWAEKQPVNSNGNHHKNGIGTEEVREIPYEEAIRQYRKRRPAQEGRRVQAPVAAAEAAKKVEPEVKVAAYPPAAVPQESPVGASPLYASETKTIPATVTPPTAATALSQMSAVATIPSVIAVAANPPLAAKDPVARIAKPKTVWQRKATDAAQESTSPEVTIRASQKAEDDATTVAAETSAASVVKTRPLTKKRHVSSSEKATAQATSKVKENAASGQAKPGIQVRPQVKKQPASGPAAHAIRTGAQTKKRTASVAAPARRAAPAASKLRGKKHPAFRRILANSIQAQSVRTPKTRAPKKQAAAPDRNRRITTRFSTAEERRIEKQAADAGLTVSAWLRHCALAQPGTQIGSSGKRAAKAENERASTKPSNYQPETIFSQPTTSLLGNWLTLLRHRFLASPQRFAERA